MKILAILGEPFIDSQIELQENFFRLLYLLQKRNDVTFISCSNKISNNYNSYINKSKINLLDFRMCYKKTKQDKVFRFEIDKEAIKGFDLIYIYGMYLCDCKKANKFYKEFNKSEFINITYNYDKYIYNNLAIIISVLEQNKNSKVIYQIIDYLEPYNFFREIRKDIIVKGTYGIEKENIEDSFFNELFYYVKSNSKIKEFDFVFGYNCTNDKRKKLSDFINSQRKEENFVVFAKDKFTKKNNLVNQKQYLEYIKKSKFSLVAPANDNRRFSNLRFLECVFNGCIPLLLKDSNFEEYFKIREGLLNFYLENNLIIDYDCDINKKIKELNYYELINKINETEFMKRIKNIEKVKKEVLNDFKENKNGRFT